MSDSTPPPPTTGNGKYIAVMLLLVIGMGGIFFIWRWKDQQQPVTVVPPPPTVPTNNRLDDIPPPPPEEPDAGPEVATASTRPQQAWGPCEVKSCNGDLTPELNNSLAFRGQQARKCYQTALNANETLQGKVAISVRIGSNGTVCSSGVASSDPGLEGVAQCVANNFRATRFPNPKNGCVDTKVPLSFIAGGH